MNGNIINIERFAVHDGPGIRSTVFLKGCPLRCVWCQNPEGIENKISLWYFEKKCIRCNQCVAACKNNALTAQDVSPHILIDRAKCTNAGRCVEACPTTALCFDGSTVSHEEVMEVLLEDKQFYEQSGGGVTLSGGDPLFQHEFSLEILKTCKSQGIHTAIETCMYGRPEIIERFFKYVDMFIVDLKIFDSLEHKKYTGVENEIIKANFELIASKKDEVLVRIPLIPGITATKENIKQIARFVHNTNSGIPIELMNYNSLAENKYRLMGNEYKIIKGLKPLSEMELEELYKAIEEEGVAAIRQTKVK
jgi:pyruvate formate lyase activating enzyme